MKISRRETMQLSASALAGLALLSRLPAVRADDAELNPNLVRLNADIEPLVRAIEETPREKLLEEIAGRIRKGTSYREVLIDDGIATARDQVVQILRGQLARQIIEHFGYKAIENKMHVHDLHATILYLLGIDHTKLTYRYSGRDFRLTDTAGKVVHDIIA